MCSRCSRGCGYKAVEGVEILKVMGRIDRQVEQVTDLIRELEKEKSYRGTDRLVQLIIQALLDLGLMVITALGAGRLKGTLRWAYCFRILVF